MRQPSDDPVSFSLSTILQVNLIQTNDFDDILDNLPNRAQSFDLDQVKQIDEVIEMVISWNKWRNPDGLSNLPIALRNYRKQFNRPRVEKDVS